MRAKRFLGILCIFAFIVTALTSIPLFVNYIGGVAPKFQLIVDLHAWFGVAFLIFVPTMIVTNRRFVKAMLKGGN